MSGLAIGDNDSGEGLSSRALPALRETVVRPGVMVASGHLMAPGGRHLIPTLAGVPTVHRWREGSEVASVLARRLLELGIADAGTWEEAGADAHGFIGFTLRRWIQSHGAAEADRRFQVSVTLGAEVVEAYSTPVEPVERTGDRMFLLVEPGSAGYVVLGPTLGLLEKVHPRLPVTFTRLFFDSLTGWIRIYDYRDAEDRVALLQDWLDQEDEGEYEVPDVNAAIPASVQNGEPFSARHLQRLLGKVRAGRVRQILAALVELRKVSNRGGRPQISEDVSEMLMDCNPPLPMLLAVFQPNDAVEACFDDEAQGMLEATPEPNLILPFNRRDGTGIRRAFDTLGKLCETLAAASRLIELMPGNEEYGFR